MLSAGSGATLSREAYAYKIYWASWHQKLGELAMDVIGPAAELGQGDGEFGPLTKLYLMSRAETIYGGTNEIQRNIIAERALGLPREPRGTA
jgi:alkylation response protein AidB-like acyl-CoA dehydrogenase